MEESSVTTSTLQRKRKKVEEIYQDGKREGRGATGVEGKEENEVGVERKRLRGTGTK